MKLQHYYAEPIGTGEFSRNRFRPVCDPFAEPIHIPPTEQTYSDPEPGVLICETCATVREAMIAMTIANHPAGKGRTR